MIENKICSICGDSNWHSLDHLRNKQYWLEQDYITEDEDVTFKICKECGYCTYDYIDDDRLNERYNRQRKITNFNNIITCNRKNEYHKDFLKDLGVTRNNNALDIGCSQGAYLNMMETVFLYDVYGVEVNEPLANYARYEYGLTVSKEIDKTIKYDLISMYHVLEHIQYPEKILETCREIISEDGLLYLSVPLWFDELDETSGIACNDWENWFHLNHVNVFSKQSFLNLLKKTGWEVTRIDEKEMYGFTVLCKKVERTDTIIKENYTELEDILTRQKQALDFANAKKLDEALKAYPKYPDVYTLQTITSEGMKDLKLQKGYLEVGMKVCPKNTKLIEQYAKIHFQWDENTPEKVGFYGNNIRTSEKYFLELLKLKPGNETANYFLGMIEAKYKKNYVRAREYMNEVLRINPAKFAEIMNMVGLFWKERGIDEKN